MSDNKQTDHEYDGIRELDNDLPNWWLIIFYITIIFSPLYMIYYHFGGGGLTSSQAYEKEIALAKQELQKPENSEKKYSDEEMLAIVQDPARIAKGKLTFDGKCIACHGVTGGGGIGPNMTDDYWIHGGSPAKIVNTIVVGVPEKGMIAWGPILSQEEILDVTAFIKSLRGTNPKDAKAPQGELESL